MVNRFIRAFLLALGLPCLAWAQSLENPILSQYLVKSTNAVNLRTIAEKYEIQAHRGPGYLVLVPVPETKEFLSLAPGAELLEFDISAKPKAQVAANAGWHTFDSVQRDLDKVAQTHSAIASVDKYGESTEGRPLRYLRILSKVKTDRVKPQLVISAATHGNELITVEVVLGLANELLKGYGRDSRLTKIVDNYELFFIPVVCPDGYIRQERWTNGVDPNRNYPYPENPHQQSNPAVKGVMDFFASHDIKGSMDYHSAAGMIMYPWAWTYEQIPEPDRTKMDELTSRMAETNGYAHGPIATTIYIAPGSSADYYYWKFGSHSLGIEIAVDGSPSLIPSMLQENMESTWRFIESF